MKFIRGRARHSAAIILSCALASCGGGSNTAPEPPPTTTPVTTPPVTQPAAPRLGSRSCDRLGEGKDGGNRCPRESPTFLGDVDRAIAQLANEQPQIFDTGRQIGPEGYFVRSSGQFYVGMIEKLDAMGLCAAFDGEELQIKNTNAYNDQYHVITSAGHLRRGESSYRATCYPAAFPTFRPLPGQVAGCSLPPSREITCAREESGYLRDIEAALDAVAKRPDAVNVNDTQRGTNWFKIINHDKYITYMSQELSAKGYCTFFDGEELQVKKVNKYAELFDITTADQYARRGEGAYRSTCYPASF